MKNPKFRIYDKSQEKMIYSNNNDDNYAIQGKREWLPFRFDIGFSHYDTNDFSEMMMCTGLKDKNGTRIWEGDIVKFEWRDDRGWVEKIGYVEFDYGRFYIEHKGNFYSANSFEIGEVIGNIHDNPEMLEVSHD